MLLKRCTVRWGILLTDENDIAQRGLIVRHLILPERLAGSEESLTWLANEVSPEVSISLMAQYYPTHHATPFPCTLTENYGSGIF